MSSTNVHSSEHKHICGGQTIAEAPDKNLNMPPQSAGRGPSVIEVRQGEKAVIAVQENIVVKDGDKVIGRATKDGVVLSGNASKVKQVLNKENER